MRGGLSEKAQRQAATGLRRRDQKLQRRGQRRRRYPVDCDRGRLPRFGRAELRAQVRQAALGRRRHHAGSAALAFSTMAWNATGSWIARLSLIHISEPTRQAEISYAVF